ncbi:hypothetical protein P43SY_008837 [Pythium insidiosum]|uniref:polynucleotide adenylyltransferase n=1 Tax=Pythium insidiosum TaxID=114742 RepID=A0AAD5QBM5_PYTIN|nr:hypothetical protein P43SY_008837 [Pythium insidiosum]
MSRTKNAARRGRGSPSDAAPDGGNKSKISKKQAKAKIKAKAKARHEAKLQKESAKAARKAAAAAADNGEHEAEEDGDAVSDQSRSEDYKDGDDDGFIAMDADEPPRRAATTPAASPTEDGEVGDDPSRLMHERMPWMCDKEGYFQENLYVALHEEILDFVRFMSPTPEELDRRRELVDEMTALVTSLWDGATMDTFGSHRTQLFLPNSDIDIVIFGVPSGTKPLFELAERLEALDMVSYLEVIDKARIPIVKFVHKASNIQVDVSFNVSSGLATADLVRHYMRVYPAFRPLTLVLKYFLAQRTLNETFAGGIGSFLLQLMVISFLQHHRRSLGPDHDAPQHNNLGQLLLGFLTLYGRDWNYDDLGFSVRNGGTYFFKEDRDWYDASRPFLLSVENPNEPELDVGKNSYEIRTVKRSFEYARQVLLNEIHRRGQFHPLAGSILGTIIPADSHLTDRVGPEVMGFDILYHDPKKTAEARRQYEMRRDEEARKRALEAANKRQEQQQRRQKMAGGGPAQRWRGRTTQLY